MTFAEKKPARKLHIPSNWEYAEIQEEQLLQANFEKVNSYKNFRCGIHDKFYELNLYQKSPINSHHWRATLARPSRDIDLHLRFPKEQPVTWTSCGENVFVW
ncbi:hypothetical protein HYQ46_004975 [Verticillium longisporum]|nr:hypothetical protein HYQ46_004975 [Verticillium longisporum]